MSPEEIIRILKEKTVTKFDVKKTELPGEFKDALFEALKENTVLKEFALQDCQSPWVANVLAHAPHLDGLNIAGSNIGEKGAIIFAKDLAVNNKLLFLSLAFNDMKDEGTEAIASALKSNTSLLSLNMRQNKITDRGAKALIEALAVNTTLVVLNLIDLGGNRICSENMNKIDLLIERNKILREYQNSENPDPRAFWTFLSKNAKLGPDYRDYQVEQEVIVALIKQVSSMGTQDENEAIAPSAITAYAHDRNTYKRQ